MGAMAVLVAFCLPFVESNHVVASALEVAIDGAHNLWMVPAAAIAILWILARRRTIASMAASRGAIVALSVGALLPILYTTRRIHTMAGLESAELTWRAGLWTIVAACAVCAIGAPWLGRSRRGRSR